MSTSTDTATRHVLGPSAPREQHAVHRFKITLFHHQGCRKFDQSLNCANQGDALSPRCSGSYQAGVDEGLVNQPKHVQDLFTLCRQASCDSIDAGRAS
jgi:hypothetical protein